MEKIAISKKIDNLIEELCIIKEIDNNSNPKIFTIFVFFDHLLFCFLDYTQFIEKEKPILLKYFFLNIYVKKFQHFSDSEIQRKNFLHSFVFSLKNFYGKYDELDLMINLFFMKEPDHYIKIFIKTREFIYNYIKFLPIKNQFLDDIYLSMSEWPKVLQFILKNEKNYFEKKKNIELYLTKFYNDKTKKLLISKNSIKSIDLINISFQSIMKFNEKIKKNVKGLNNIQNISIISKILNPNTNTTNFNENTIKFNNDKKSNYFSNDINSRINPPNSYYKEILKTEKSESKQRK